MRCQITGPGFSGIGFNGGAAEADRVQQGLRRARLRLGDVRAHCNAIQTSTGFLQGKEAAERWPLALGGCGVKLPPSTTHLRDRPS